MDIYLIPSSSGPSSNQCEDIKSSQDSVPRIRIWKWKSLSASINWMNLGNNFWLWNKTFRYKWQHRRSIRTFGWIWLRAGLRMVVENGILFYSCKYMDKPHRRFGSFALTHFVLTSFCLYRLYKRMAKGCQQLANLERSQEFLMAETFFGEVQYQIRNVEAAKVKKAWNSLSLLGKPLIFVLFAHIDLFTPPCKCFYRLLDQSETYWILLTARGQVEIIKQHWPGTSQRCDWWFGTGKGAQTMKNNDKLYSSSSL